MSGALVTSLVPGVLHLVPGVGVGAGEDRPSGFSLQLGLTDGAVVVARSPGGSSHNIQRLLGVLEGLEPPSVTFLRHRG